jgi:rod shape determining protein RodA
LSLIVLTIFLSVLTTVSISSCFVILGLTDSPNSYPFLLKPYQIERIISFLNPHYDPQGINYNSLQAIIAIGSGGLFGKGFASGSQSRLQFLPENHTDFVFASFTETFGLTGALVLVICYFFFLKSLLDSLLTLDNNQPLYTNFSYGVFLYLFVQFFFNIGMNLRILPVVGVPLPLISYGGGTILTIYLLLGLREKLKEL